MRQRDEFMSIWNVCILSFSDRANKMHHFLNFVQYQNKETDRSPSTDVGDLEE